MRLRVLTHSLTGFSSHDDQIGGTALAILEGGGLLAV